MAANDAAGRVVPLLVWAAPTGPKALLDAPTLVHKGDTPELSATFLLERQPTLEAPQLEARVERASLGMTLTLAPPLEALAALRAGALPAAALFPEEAVFSLRRQGDELCRVRVTDGLLTAALSGTLEREDARLLLSAFGSAGTGLELHASVAYRAAAPATVSVVLSTDVAVVHRRLADGAANGVVYDLDLLGYLEAMLGDGSISSVATPSTDASAHALAVASIEAFKRALSWIITPLADDERRADLGRRYHLTSGPVPSAQITIRSRLSLATGPIEWLELSADVHSVLRGVRVDDSARVQFLSLAEGGGGVETLRRRVKAAAPRAVNRTERLALRIASDRVSSAELRRAGVIQGAPVASGPELSGLPYWQDVRVPNLYWYASELAPVMPTLSDTLDETPFRFVFERVPGHGIDGRPALQAQLRVTLQQVIPTNLSASSLAAGSVTKPVPMQNPQVELQIPFRNERGQDALQSIAASALRVSGERVEATFELLDSWARVAYGALSQPGFQSRPVRVIARYGYKGYVEINNPKLDWLLPQRIQAALANGELVARERGVGAADTTRTIVLGDGTSLHLPPLGRAEPRGRFVTAADAEAGTPVPVIVRPHVTVQRPPPSQPPRFKAISGRHDNTAELFVPCAAFGALYAERTKDDIGNSELRAIGCQSAYQLGQTEARQYEPLSIPDGVATGKVYRSLQSAGSFLFVPKAYRITRFEPDDEVRAYRPHILLYSTLNTDDASLTRCVVLSSLEHSGGAAELQSLREHLRQHHHSSPRLELLHEVGGEMRFDWSLPTGSGQLLQLEVEAVRSAVGFDVGLVTDGFGVPQLQAILANSGIAGEAALTLPDGTRLATALRLHLKEVLGPASGPVTSELLTDKRVRLRNEIESPVVIRDVLLLDADGRMLEAQAVGLRLEPGADASLELNRSASAVLSKCRVESTAASLVELKSFIEDLTLAPVLLNRVDLAAFGLQTLRVELSIVNVPGRVSVEFVEGSEAVASPELLLPLTVYLANPSLSLVATLIDSAGQSRTKSPIVWNISQQGIVVSLTPALLGLE